MNPYCLPDSLLEQLLHEDSPYGDATSFALGLGAHQGELHFATRQAMTLCASEDAQRMAQMLGLHIDQPARASGARLTAGEPILTVSGAADALHRLWKPAQTLMEYLSGIASAVSALVDAARAVSPDIGVACTRKTFPGGKVACIKAVLAGGAVPHRLSVSETLLLFAEHRTFLPDASPEAMLMALRSWSERKTVVEVADPAEARRWIDAGAEVIQLEKCPPAHVAEVVAYARQRAAPPLIAAAGGVHAGNAADYARAGAGLLVSSAPYHAAPRDVAVSMRARCA